MNSIENIVADTTSLDNWVVGIAIWAASVSASTAAFAIFQQLRVRREIVQERHQIEKIEVEKHQTEDGVASGT